MGFSITYLDDNYSDEQLEQILCSIKGLGSELMFTRFTQYYIQSPKALRGKFLVRYYDKSKSLRLTIVAFRMGTFENRQVFYLGLALSQSTWRGLAVVAYMKLLSYIFFYNRGWYYLVSFTNSPRAFGNIAKYASEVWPNAKDSEPFDWHQKILDTVVKSYLVEHTDPSKVNVSGFTIKGLFGKKWNSPISEHADAIYNKYILEKLSLEDGDCVAQIGKMKITTVINSFIFGSYLILKSIFR